MVQTSQQIFDHRVNVVDKSTDNAKPHSQQEKRQHCMWCTCKDTIERAASLAWHHFAVMIDDYNDDEDDDDDNDNEDDDDNNDNDDNDDNGHGDKEVQLKSWLDNEVHDSRQIKITTYFWL